MNIVKYLGKEGLADSSGAIYFFGKVGRMEVLDDLIVAYISKSSQKLRTFSFSDLESDAYGEPQEIEVSKLSFNGMLSYLRVPKSATLQRRLNEFKRHKKVMEITQAIQQVGNT